MMKIVGVEAFRLHPKIMKEAWVEDEYVWPSKMPSFLIKVTADNGVHGVGEVSSQTWYLGETAEQIESQTRLYAHALEGLDPENVSLVHRAMQSCVSGGMPGSRGARSAVDMAVYDLIGKARGVPVHALLGGAYRTSFQMLTNLYHKTPEAMAAASKQFVQRGFKALKIKVGDVLLAKGWSRDNLRCESDKLRAALAAVPSDVYIDADANQGWLSAKWTVDTLSEFDGHRNLSIEQPLPYADLDGAAFVTAHAKTPVILDKSVWSPEAMMQLARMRACDRIVTEAQSGRRFFPGAADHRDLRGGRHRSFGGYQPLHARGRYRVLPHRGRDPHALPGGLRGPRVVSHDGGARPVRRRDHDRERDRAPAGGAGPRDRSGLDRPRTPPGGGVTVSRGPAGSDSK